eukprot:3339006-Lingulodinium_polyedra.AAC.1
MLRSYAATTTARKSHACALHARQFPGARAWTTQTCDFRAAAVAHGRFDHIIVQRFTNTAQWCD